MIPNISILVVSYVQLDTDSYLDKVAWPLISFKYPASNFQFSDVNFQFTYDIRLL